MSDAAWETLSNQAIAAAGVVYFLALVAHLVEWSALRTVPVAAAARVPVAAGVSTGSPDAEAPTPPAVDESKQYRITMFGTLAFYLTVIGCAAHFVGLLGRGMAADPNRVPWGNMYEFTITGSFVVVLGYLLLRKRYGLSWMGPIVTAIELVLLMVAVLWLYDPIAPLSDALLSYWLVIHVMSAIIATGAFTLGGITSALYLVKSRSLSRGKAPDHGYIARLPSLATLDRVSYRIHAFGFPVWTFAVLISGPIWAHQAWSSYWNWDPKEVCAFITWVLYAAYLHARSTAGWKGRNAAILALVGVASLWFNFIGINYFSTTSQHSYANGAKAFDLHHR
ncbi:c-type cytochrome biogenesis protein CcsB [Nocardioides cynanchi]|uniref:c-type cytochrome biogenesis protein CcsB n=1 Tax=Nocardioides cynanchi TaxID=2558918 RepID=UPI0012466A7C|nr:c-type cytochrome biogenesis protein CcsB [Nocardioides cynanchi]